MRIFKTMTLAGASIACLMAAGANAAPKPAVQASLAAPAGMKVERVVILMRHGIRPPTKAAVTPPGLAKEAWPSWDTPWGHLTAHGYQAIVKLGAYDRQVWAREGVIAATACPAKGEVVVWSDTDERTIRTGDAMVEGAFAGCNVTNDHLAEGVVDVLFSPLDDPKSIDTAAARDAVLAEVGPLDAVMKSHRPAFEIMQRVLDCCAPAPCTDAGLKAGCAIADMPVEISVAGGEGRPKATGPLDWAPSVAQALMLEYVEGKPMSEVGWGRASRADIEVMMEIHTLKGDILQRPAYISRRGASPLVGRMLGALEGAAGNGSKLTVIVGHDTNIVDVSGMLDFDWKVDSYPANNPPPGGGVGFELLSDAAGKHYVRAFYRAQTMDQMRALSPLSLADPAYRQPLKIPGCSMPGDDTICTLADFSKLVRGKLITPGS